MKVVAFFVRHFTERGTEVSTYNYAHFNEKILRNKSLIIAYNGPKQKKIEPFINTTRKIFEKRFEVIEIQNIEEMRQIILLKKISFCYIQSHGTFRDYYQLSNKKIWQNCVTTYHYVFGPMIRQGSVNRAVLGEDLNKRFNKKIPVLPYIVEEFKELGNLRDTLNIPKNAFVYGRHGGFKTFDIELVHICIREILSKRDDIYFIFLNTEKFYKHKNIIYLDRNSNLEFKLKFISSCDAMIHSRKDGETFGLSVAEFSSANKPIITYSRSLDKEHIRILNKKGILFESKNELLKIFNTLNKEYISDKDWNAYKTYNPEIIMELFQKICLSKTKKSIKKILIEFLYDLPWEIYNFFKITKNWIFIMLMKLIPSKFKKIFQKILQNNIIKKFFYKSLR